MIILGIESSCDETSAAILEEKSGRIQILSNIVASSASLQSKYGGIIPEQAAREQLKSIIPVIEESLQVANLKPEDLDALAVTRGPGLIGSLLVGVEVTKLLAKIWGKPLIPVNHLIGHFYANWIVDASSKQSNASIQVPQFPCIGLLVSGGHTDLVIFKDHGKYEYIGGTRDDAAGECFDKCARLLGLPYPGGPQISKLALLGSDTFNLPRPMIDSKDFDFSFSGLKTAVHNTIVQLLGKPTNMSNSETRKLSDQQLNDLCASVEASIIEVIAKKTVLAAQKHSVEQIIVAGGVAANQKLVEELTLRSNKLGIKLSVPPSSLCTDNAAMIAAAAFFLKPIEDSLDLQANPNLSLAY
jgi:N6-L-threonylcarbamoyladenine synthase